MRVGFVGWRGMVGSVLMGRMLEENDFADIEPVFFTTSNVGGQAPNVGKETPALKDAFDIEALRELDAIISCQGGDYTAKVFSDLRSGGWQGYWIDAASSLRMADDAIIVQSWPIQLPRFLILIRKCLKKCAAIYRCQNSERRWRVAYCLTLISSLKMVKAVKNGKPRPKQTRFWAWMASLFLLMEFVYVSARCAVIAKLSQLNSIKIFLSPRSKASLRTQMIG